MIGSFGRVDGKIAEGYAQRRFGENFRKFRTAKSLLERRQRVVEPLGKRTVPKNRMHRMPPVAEVVLDRW